MAKLAGKGASRRPECARNPRAPFESTVGDTRTVTSRASPTPTGADMLAMACLNGDLSWLTDT
jgi:hypothetical protein